MTARKSSDYVKTMATKSGIGFVELWVADLAGRLRGVTVTTGQLEGAFDDGVPLPARALGVRGDAADAPLVLVPDASTWAVLPRLAPDAPPVARMFCDLTRTDGAPCPWDARGVLKRALGRATDLGYTFYVGAVIQHYYLAGVAPPRPLDHGPDHGFGPAPTRQGLAHATVQALEQLGVIVNALAQAPGPAQHQFELAWADALTLSDALVTHRRVVCDIARARGHAATFMPFPFADAPRSDLELTLSLHDGDEAAFYDPRAALGRSPAAHQFAAGVARLDDALSLLARPTLNSYTRAPTTSSLLVNPGVGGGDTEGHLLYRGADASANPYLLVAALLDAGLDGVRAANHDAPGDAAAPALPVTLVQAATLAQTSPLLRQTLGAELVSALVAAALADGAAYRTQVTPWELERYLDVH